MGLQLATPVSWYGVPPGPFSPSLGPGLQCQGVVHHLLLRHSRGPCIKAQECSRVSWGLRPLEGKPRVSPSFHFQEAMSVMGQGWHMGLSP